MNQLKSPAIATCWRTIGVWGTKTPRCEKLQDVIHCRNCKVYWDAGREVFNRTIPEGYLDQWTKTLAQKPEERAKNTLSIIYFRLGDEWFSLPSIHFVEVSQIKTAQKIPHQSNKFITGLVNVGGSVRVCFSLSKMLDVADSSEIAQKKYGMYQRYLVVKINGKDFVFRVDEVGGVYRYSPSEFKQVPSTIEKDKAGLLMGVLNIDGNDVTCIDAEKLCIEFSRSIHE